MTDVVVITEEELLVEIEKADAEREKRKLEDPEFWWVKWIRDGKWQIAIVSKQGEPFVRVLLKKRRDDGFRIVVASAMGRFPAPLEFTIDLYNNKNEEKAKRHGLRYGRWLVETLTKAPDWRTE